jgi:hypothetical protein
MIVRYALTGKVGVTTYDYVDNAIPMLARMYERRLKGYRAIGYTIEQPGLLQPLL